MLGDMLHIGEMRPFVETFPRRQEDAIKQTSQQKCEPNDRHKRSGSEHWNECTPSSHVEEAQPRQPGKFEQAPLEVLPLEQG
jgi:hypothetical protein